MKSLLITLFVSLLFLRSVGAAPIYYYSENRYGSDAIYNPISSFLSYSFDTLQVSQSFGTEDFDENLDDVVENLLHPRRAIKNEGGYRQFINGNIFPIGGDNPNESFAMLPNYALHLLGGGMVYRRDLEWFRKHKYKYSTVSSVALAVTAELIQEAIETKTTLNDDPVADFWIFRPLGMWLFHHDGFAKRFAEVTGPAIWPSLQVYDISKKKIVNTGLSYAYRPPSLATENTGLFIYTGINNLLGLSHKIGAGRSLSWGVGFAVREIDLNADNLARLDTSLGFYYDLNNSLLSSLVFNDTGGDHMRFNYFPRPKGWNGGIGLFLSKNKDNSWSAGFQYKVGFGLGHSH